MTSGLSFAVIGEVRAYRDGRELPKPGSPQQQATLVVLLLFAGHTISMAQLVDALWSQQPPPAAVRTIRTYVWRLRGLLGTGTCAAAELASAGDGYRLDIDPAAVDANRAELLLHQAANLRLKGLLYEAAEALDQALSLWRGEPLAGVPGPFAERQRDRLTELQTTVTEERLDLDLAVGRSQMAIPRLHDLACAYPLRERVHCLLMRALYGAGRQADALAAFTTARTVLVQEYGIEPGPELTALHQQILQGNLAVTTLPVAAIRARQDLSPPAAIPVPAQLPPDLPDFTGRAGEVAELCRLLTEPGLGAPAVVALVGMGGIGKTSLAVHVAHQVRGAYPDGQLYACLGGGDVGAQDAVGVVLGAFLRALGAGSVPDGPPDQGRLFRSLLDSRRMLVVLDDVGDATRLRELIPGSAGCAVIATSRSRLTGLPLVRQISLGVFDPQEALALLGRDIGADRVAAERKSAQDLAAACGWLPLAIRIAGARLAARPAWTIAALGERLADEARRLAELRAGDLAIDAVLESSYRALSASQARALRLLAFAGAGEIVLPAAAAVLGQDERNTEACLESLADAALIEPSVPGRYRFHVLVRAFAGQRAVQHDEAEARQALGRMLDFLLATARTAAGRIPLGGTASPLMSAVAAAGQRRGSAGLAVSADPARAGGLPLADAGRARDWVRADFDTMLRVVSLVLAQPQPDPVQIAAVADLLTTVNALHGASSRSRIRPVLARLAEVGQQEGCRGLQAGRPGGPPPMTGQQTVNADTARRRAR